MNASVFNPSVIALVKSWEDDKAAYVEHLWQDYKIVCRKSHLAGVDGEFLPASVKRGEEILWRFEKTESVTMAFLRDYDNEPVIMLTSPREIINVIFVGDLGKSVRVMVKGEYILISPRPILEIALCKQAMAEDDGRRKVRMSKVEAAALFDAEEAEKQLKIKHEEELRHKELAERQARHEASARKQAEKVGRILERKEISCFTVDGGSHRHGRPVVGNEWECLMNGTFCISVESFNDTTGEYGKLIECFRVAKTGAKVKKQNIERVQQEATKGVTMPSEIDADDVCTFIVSGKHIQMPVYSKVKPSVIPLSIPFAVKIDKVTTIYQRENGTLRSLGIVRENATAA